MNQNPRNLSWHEANQVRKFPLLHNATALSTDGHFRIPDDLLTGLYLSYGLETPFRDPGGFYIGSILVGPSGLSIGIYYDAPGYQEKIAETQVSLPVRDNTVMFTGLTNKLFYGHAVFGHSESLADQPTGLWRFHPEDTRIDPFCVRPVANELSALYVQSQGKTLGPFYGDITLSAGTGIEIETKSATTILQCVNTALTTKGTEVIFSTTPFSTEIGSDGKPHVVGNASDGAIRTINGVAPDASGNLELIGRECLKISPMAGQAAIFLDDTCATPCCTCKELDPIVAKITELQKSIKEMEDRLLVLSVQTEFLGQTLASLH